MTSSSIIILLTSILFCTVTIVLASMLKRSNNSKDKLLAEMQAALSLLQRSGNNQGNDLNTEQSTTIFDDNLRAAELTTRLQQPRLTAQQGSYAPAPPERYRYIQSMVEKGLNVEEIASTLSMSLHETTQLVTLIRMAHPQHRNNESSLPALDIADDLNIVSAPREQLTRACAPKQVPALKTTGTVNKSIKFARWLKGRAIAPSLRKQTGREPPSQPLPHIAGRSCQPLPGYT